MEAANFGNCDDTSDTCRLRQPAVRRVFAQSEMRPTSVVVRHVCREQTAQMTLAEHDDMVEALASN
jgi:hypothetical protein